MRKSIDLIAVGLATGVILTSALVDLPKIHAANVESKSIKPPVNNSNNNEGIPSVKKPIADFLDDNGISKSIKNALIIKDYFDDEDEITPESLSELDSKLSLPNQKIRYISGINYATKVTSLNLSNNEITDISDLEGMNLIELRIGQNQITDFSSLNNMVNLSTVTLSPQTVENDLKVVNKGGFNLNLNDYVGSGAAISDIEASINNGNSKLDMDDSQKIISVSNILNSDTLTIKFTETININGEDEVVKITMTQPYTVGTGSISTKSVTMKVGDKWTDDLGFESAVDPFGKDLTVNDFGVNTNNLDTNTEGTYEVRYTSKEYSDITGIAQVTVENDSDNLNDGNDTGSNNNNGSNSDVTTIDKMLLSSKKTDSIAIYDANGSKISDKTLTGVTDFSTTKKNVVNGTTYYQISDGQWVKESDVVEYFEYSGTIQTNSDSIKKLSNLNGEASNRGLEQTTDWKSDRYTNIKGQKHYRVSSNEWIKENDVLEITPVKGVLKINAETKLYRDNGKQSNRGLAKDSDFVTDKKATINGKTMYRVSTNEWVPESFVSLK
ncbi:SLAP domain-containing protein [Companilactobacillus baiquanensis]|uniref:SLAP domain-containing protein n=1 Tax=Companilactobacillus baiquanensis TaxID=2486005 RepID=A0ABW1UUQ5_9LACO|nr:SLAP domain-containing protein [Companilactobacillus baiquanensis]